MPTLHQHLAADAARARSVLDEAFGPLHDFLWSQLNDDGGFAGPDSRSALHATAHGLAALLALDCQPPRAPLIRYLDAFGTGDGLTLPDLADLISAHARLNPASPAATPERRTLLIDRVSSFRADDAGFAATHHAATLEVAPTFAACAALEDLRHPIADTDRLIAALNVLRSSDGGFANDAALPLPTTAATAYASILLKQLSAPVDPATIQWLLDRQLPAGGFVATPQTRLPDLMSTALALHALHRQDMPLDDFHDHTFDFLDRLWARRGSFRPTFADETINASTTWYGLLTLGHLAPIEP